MGAAAAPTPRRRVDGGDEAPQDRRPVAKTPRARSPLPRTTERVDASRRHARVRSRRGTRRRHAQVLQLKSKIEQAMRDSARESHAIDATLSP